MSNRKPVHRGWRVDPSAIERELARRGLTATEIADISGVALSTVAKMRRGEYVAPLTLRKVSAALTSVPVLTVDLVGEGEK